MSPQQLRDALSLHYHRPMIMMPHSCDGCSAVFSVSHAWIVVERDWLYSNIMQ